MIKAFHSNWTRPFFNLNSKDSNYFIEDFEILTTILSALKWRQENGSIKMITDSIAAEYYSILGIDSIWDLGMEVTLDSLIPKEIDPKIFWAAGKIYALREVDAPCAMIDTDFIVWKSIEDILTDATICTIHKEGINENVYPGKEYFNVKEGYNFDSEWSWDVLPSNTAFTYIKDAEFKDYYVNSSIDFMHNIKNSENKLTNMVFAEQRLISMCADKMNLEIKELMNLEQLFNGQDYYTHIWGFKSRMRDNFRLRNEFCVKCIKRIIRDYPQYEPIIANINQLSYYYHEVKEDMKKSSILAK